MPGVFESIGNMFDNPCQTVGKGIDSFGKLNQQNFTSNVDRLCRQGISHETANDIAFNNWIGSSDLP